MSDRTPLMYDAIGIPANKPGQELITTILISVISRIE